MEKNKDVDDVLSSPSKSDDESSVSSFDYSVDGNSNEYRTTSKYHTYYIDDLKGIEKFTSIHEKNNCFNYFNILPHISNSYSSPNEKKAYTIRPESTEPVPTNTKVEDPNSLGSNERPFACSTCGKCFRLSSTLCRHKIIHTSQRPHKCDICAKSFNRSSTLKTHLRTHNQTKEFMCTVCDKGFHQKGNLRNHVLIHTGEKPYSCHYCSKAFNKLSNLKFHMHTHTDQMPYRCRFCKKSMARRGELKHHIMTMHHAERMKEIETEANSR